MDFIKSLFFIYYYFYLDIRNFLYIRNVLTKANKEDKKFKDFNLRLDWICRPYTVVSLRKEDLGESKEVQDQRIMYEHLTPLNMFLDYELGLLELLRPVIKPATNNGRKLHGVYIIYYNPFLLGFSWQLIIQTVLFYYGFKYLFLNYPVWDYLMTALDFIKTFL